MVCVKSVRDSFEKIESNSKPFIDRYVGDTSWMLFFKARDLYDRVFEGTNQVYVGIRMRIFNEIEKN